MKLDFLEDSRRFLWSSERSGFRHLYLYDTSGQQLAQLTQGNWEVTSLVGVDEAAGAVFFTATAESPLQRQLYRVNLNGQGFERVTREGGTHDVHMLAGSVALVDIWSNQGTPPSLSLLHSDGRNKNPDRQRALQEQRKADAPRGISHRKNSHGHPDGRVDDEAVGVSPRAALPGDRLYCRGATRADCARPMGRRNDRSGSQ